MYDFLAFRKRKQDKDYIRPLQELLRTWLASYANLDEQAVEHTISQYQQTNRQLSRFPFDIDLGDLDFDAIEAMIAEELSDS